MIRGIKDNNEKFKNILEYRNYKLDIELDSKITLIVGLSGTGKSTMHNVLTKINTKRKQGKIDISDDKFSITYINNEQALLDRVQNDKLPSNRVYIVDEGNIKVDKHIVVIIKNTIDSVKRLVVNENGVTTFKNYISTHTKDSNKSQQQVMSTNKENIKCYTFYLEK